MRYGIIRDAPFLPATATQEALIEAFGCDVAHREQGGDFVSDRRIHSLTAQLRPGDELAIYSLASLRRPGAPGAARVLRELLDRDIVVTALRVAGKAQSLTRHSQALQVLDVLADHERLRAALVGSAAHQGGSRNALSKFQIAYARKLRAEGVSLRAIGLIFQMSPNQMLDIVADPADPSPPDPGPSVTR